MSGVCAFVVATSLGASRQDIRGDWQIWLTETSGWGSPSGLYVDSQGRNVAYRYPNPNFRSLMTDLQRGVPTTFCERSPLSEDQVREFSTHVSNIPSDVLEMGHLAIRGSCFDEPVIGITLKMHGRAFHFGYSTLSHCRDGQDVPRWLTTLTDALWVRFREIENCGLITAPAETAS
jgi:hypothetical protein